MIARALPIFSAFFIVAYAVSMKTNGSLLTYYPRSGSFVPFVGAQTDQTGPAMYWYGWLIVAFLAAALATIAFELLVPERIASRIRPWAVSLVPVLGIAFFINELSPAFR